jgi:hypothetical protein
MRVPQMTTRRMMSAAAALAFLLGGFLAVSNMERHSVLCNQRAEYHRWKEDHLMGTAGYLESLAGNPAKSYELLNALAAHGKRWKERAAAARLELMESDTPGERWYREAREAAMKRAQACRQESEYHGRQKLRYARAAFEPWNHLAPDTANPE